MSIWGNLVKLIAILLMMAGVPTFVFILKTSYDPTVSIILFVLFEVVVFVVGFFNKVLEKLESKWTDRVADRIDQIIVFLFSGYRRKYIEYITYQHRFFDVKGLRTQGPYNLELEKVFVQLSVHPTPFVDVKSDPFSSVPEPLRSGAHTIWEFVNAAGMGNHSLAILGSPGCGKTTLLKHMALALAAPSHRRKKIGAPNLLPILLFLRDHAADIQATPDISLAKLIRTQFERRQAPIPPDGWLESQLENGNCLVMLDGLDEVASFDMRKCVVEWVERCMSGICGKNRFVISSRPHGYRTNPLANITVLQIKPFTNAQVKQFVQNWYLANEIMSSQRDDPGVRADAKQGADDLLDRLYRTPTLSELSVNPLLLTMIATVHRYKSRLPGRRVELYAEICDVFLGRRHGDFDMTPAQKQRILKPLAFHMIKANSREIARAKIEPVITTSLLAVNPLAKCQEFINDTVNTSGLIIERENGVYSFSHLTFQEYLASVYILENRWEGELIKSVDQPWWHETIRLYCAQTDASNIIRACLNSANISALALAIDCMEEALEVDPQTRKQYDAIIKQGVVAEDLQRRTLAYEARLQARLRNT